MTFHTDGHNKYTGTPTGGYTMPAVENPYGGRYEAKTIYLSLIHISIVSKGNDGMILVHQCIFSHRHGVSFLYNGMIIA